MSSRIFLQLGTLAALILVCLPSCRRKAGSTEVIEIQKDTVYPLGFCTDSFDAVTGTLKNGEIFTGLMTRLGMGTGDAYTLATSIDSVFDMKKMRAGNEWHAFYDTLSGKTLRYLVYDVDKVNRTVIDCIPPYGVWRASKPVDIERKFSDVTINSSLWNDMLKNGVSPLLIVNLSDVYAWTVDFFGLQKGDRFRVLYEQEVCDGEIIGVNDIYYAVFSREGKELPAIMLDLGDKGNRYWNPAGESMRKAFLKAPLKFTRISSGFSYHRKHPVSGQVKAHTAVDYAAPTGTPVMSIGDGTVLSRGWTAGGGNTVKIRHNSVYTTSYMHLSKFASGLKNGQRVSQGEVIGYVGATGVATGPHLDFRVYKNGTAINPLKMEAPAAEPLPQQYLPALDSVSRLYRHELDSLSAITAL